MNRILTQEEVWDLRQIVERQKYLWDESLEVREKLPHLVYMAEKFHEMKYHIMELENDIEAAKAEIAQLLPYERLYFARNPNGPYLHPNKAKGGGE